VSYLAVLLLLTQRNSLFLRKYLALPNTNMFASASTSLMFLVQCYLISVIASDENNPICNQGVSDEDQKLSLADCQAAIDMIPALTWSVDPASSGDRSQSKLIDVQLDRPDRKYPLLPDRPVRKSALFFPAAFRSRSCVVLVGPSRPYQKLGDPSTPPFQPPVQAASAMYTKVWPEVRRAATMILDQCFREGMYGLTGCVR
jgi:hypothetical protein